jgi:hypothetical protein
LSGNFLFPILSTLHKLKALFWNPHARTHARTCTHTICIKPVGYVVNRVWVTSLRLESTISRVNRSAMQPCMVICAGQYPISLRKHRKFVLFLDIIIVFTTKIQKIDNKYRKSKPKSKSKLLYDWQSVSQSVSLSVSQYVLVSSTQIIA